MGAISTAVEIVCLAELAFKVLELFHMLPKPRIPAASLPWKIGEDGLLRVRAADALTVLPSESSINTF